MKPEETLTKRERRIIGLATAGLKNREIAVRIGSTEQSVKNYMRSIFDKLGLDNRVQVALWRVSRDFHSRKNLLSNR